MDDTGNGQNLKPEASQIIVMFYLIISWGKFWNRKCWFIITDAEVDQVLHGKRNCKMTEKDGSID